MHERHDPLVQLPPDSLVDELPIVMHPRIVVGAVSRVDASSHVSHDSGLMVMAGW